MKKLFIFLLAVLPLVSNAQTVEANAELGTRASYTCWVWQGFDVPRANEVYPRITGVHSFRSGALSNNESPTAQALSTPWMIPAAGNITFKMRFNASGSQTRFMRLFFIPADANVSNFAGEPVLITKVDLTPNTTEINNFSFPVPSEFIGKVGRFRISFNGNGGSNRAIVDDLVFPGLFLSDPSSNCTPILAVSDSDKDGIADDEDDFPTDFDRAFKSYLTNQNFSTLKFEDLWPAKGDFDFNDLVNDLRISVISSAKNEVIELVIESRTRAIGAAFSNGLGLELTGIRSDAIKSVKGHILGGGTIHKLGSNQLEEGQEFATVILFDNAFSVLQRVTGGTGINVDPSSPMSEVKTQTVTVSFEPGKVKNSELTMGMLNPFMIINQDRGREVHLAGKQPTRLANSSLFGTGVDITKVGSLQTYLSKEDNLPWAIWINESIPYMQEKVEITKGFVMLRYWANSNGEKMQDWYMDIPGHINRELVIGNK